MHVVVIGTYPPTRCGIATFTADVESSLRRNHARVTVVPIGRESDGDWIQRDDRSSYIRAAHRLNSLGCDLVLIQHEFGIFGGRGGSHILALIDELTSPYAVTLHTVLPEFTSDQLWVLERVCREAAAVTVFTETARRLMMEQELAAEPKLHVVAHGAPPELFEPIDPAEAREKFSIPLGVPLMLTFGLLSEGKGVEDAIRAVALLRAQVPNLHYIVAGRTHPEIVRRDGESYRASLQTLIEGLGLERRVILLDRFLEVSELAQLLAAADLVCTPYHGENQSVSGVLTFSLAAGKPVVSTPYSYAREVLAGGAGRLVSFRDEEALARGIHELLGPAGHIARVAARHGSSRWAWPNIGAELLAVLREAVQPVSRPVRISRAEFLPPVPTPATSYLRVLCDGKAVLQHAHLCTPKLDHGYCVDDAGRMLPVIGDLTIDDADQSWGHVMSSLLSFLGDAAQGGLGQMRNFMSIDGQWLDEPHIGDHVGRAIWGLGEASNYDEPFAVPSRQLFVELVRHVSNDWPSKTLAYAALGLVAACEREPHFEDHLARLVPTLRKWTPQPSLTWRWFEPRLTYDSARIPEVLLRVGHQLDLADLVDAGKVMLDWFDALSLQYDYYRFPGHRGLSSGQRLIWSGDEQPIEAAALADAHLAWLQLSGDVESATAIQRVWSWFLGDNRLGRPLMDLHTGASCDGIGERTLNLNCGAESTIAAHRCWRTYSAARSLCTPTRSLTLTQSISA